MNIGAKGFGGQTLVLFQEFPYFAEVSVDDVIADSGFERVSERIALSDQPRFDFTLKKKKTIHKTI